MDDLMWWSAFFYGAMFGFMKAGVIAFLIAGVIKKEHPISVKQETSIETPEQIAERIEREYSIALSDKGKHGLFAAILSALRNRDERAAKIAEAHEGHGSWCSSAAGDCQSLTVKAIAAAIRKGDR